MNPLIWEQDRWNIAGGKTRSSHYSGSLLRSCNSKTIVHARLQLKLQASICGFYNFFWWRFGSFLQFVDSSISYVTTMIRQQEHEFKHSTETAIKSFFIPIFTSRRPLQCIKNVYCNERSVKNEFLFFILKESRLKFALKEFIVNSL